MTSIPASVPVPAEAAPSISGRLPYDRSLVAIVLGALLTSQIVAIALGLWHPDSNLVPFIEGHRDEWWAWHTASGIVFVVTAGSYTAVMWWLVPGRGRLLAVAGGMLMTAGVAAFGAGLMAEAAADWYASGTTALTPAASHELLVYVNSNGAHFDGAITAGLILTVLGPLVSAVGLSMSRSVGWWLIGLFAIGSVAGTVFGPLEALSLVAYALMSWRVWRA